MSVGDGNGGGFAGTASFPWRWLALGALVILLAVVTPGCGGGGDDDGGSGGGGNGTAGLSESELRRQIIQTVGNGFILPTYGALVEEADALIQSVSNFCTDRTEINLTAAQEQWRVVTGLAMESELVNVRFGPAYTLGEFVRVSWSRGEHADTDGIDARIVDGRSPAANERGLEGIEYLIFGHPDDGVSVVLATFDGETGDKRCSYLEMIVASLHADVEGILSGWESGGGDYIGVWNSAGEAGNTTYRTLQSAIDALFSRVEFVIDNLVNRKLQPLNWKRSEPDFWRSGNSIASLQHNIVAAEMLYLGVNRGAATFGLENYMQQRGGLGQFGVDDYLRETGQSALDAAIQDQFDVALAALEAIPVSLRDAVDSHMAHVDTAIAEARELLRLLKREMAQDQLDVFFEFNSADGD